MHAAFPTITLVLAAGLISAGSGAPQNSTLALPGSAVFPNAFRSIAEPDAAMEGIYVSAFYGSAIDGFNAGRRGNHKPICSIPAKNASLNGREPRKLGHG